MGNISAPVRLALNISVYLGPKVSVQSYSKVKRVLIMYSLSPPVKDFFVSILSLQFFQEKNYLTYGF